MDHPKTCTLLISTYNWPEALLLCLESVAKQSVPPKEIIIADDGSGTATKKVIDDFAKRSSIAIQHIWHPDNGFQLSKIRNKAIDAAQYPYIIQIDGDVILDTHFVEDHLRIATEKFFVTGSRVNLKEDFSKKLLRQATLPEFKTLKNNAINKTNSLRIPLITSLLEDFYKVKGKYKDFTRGCNMAYWKADILKVNGYDESMVGWGSEDKELVVRLLNLGVKKKFAKFSAIQYHIWHPYASREKETINHNIYIKSIEMKKISTEHGIKNNSVS